jgi:prepilin-type N-terminal cleavage/methylation domain-containing protein
VTGPTRDPRGFTSIEVLVATLILSVGLAAVATGLQHASSGIETGRGETTAAFLAEQQLEQLKNLALADWPSTTLSAGTTTEAYGAIPHAAVYRRVTTITDSPGGTCTANCKLVRITVFYRPVTGQGQLDQERRLDVVTMFVSRI